MKIKTTSNNNDYYFYNKIIIIIKIIIIYYNLSLALPDQTLIWWAKGSKLLPVQRLQWTMLFKEMAVSRNPLPAPQPQATHPPTVRAVPGLSACVNLDGKPPQMFDTALAWSRAVPSARQKKLLVLF